MHKFFRSILVVLVLLSLCGRFAQAELMIEITEGSANALPIAVVPFSAQGGVPVPEDIARIISNNLQRSGDFDVLPTGRMLSLPDSMEQVHYRDWRLLGQTYVVVGQVSFDAATQQFRVQYELIDVYGQKRLLGERLSVPGNGLRKLSHLISDKVYETITGVRGAFSTKIAYITLRNLPGGKQEYRLQVADADGQNAYTLFKSHEPILSPAWSNDGQHLAYSSFHTGRPAIYIQHARTGGQRKVTSFTGLNSAPMWSPDDSQLVMTLSKDGNAEIYTYDLASNTLKRLTNHYGIDTEASWSPDGKELVFTSDRSGKPQIYRMKLSDLRPQRLTFEGRYNARPRFSLDGKSLYYVHQVNGDFHIAAIDMETGDNRVLTSTPLDESPSVAPNGRMIMYATNRNDKGVLAVVSVDGGAKYFLPSDYGDVKEPAWSPFLN
ncbi:MAG: Tol-Pal system beta propeller repeat protein TolB [Oleiphilaceae bacterium]|nr:Tol-Pal system beta propeller repeat protein TolB [Oleiphilaceae bacterium]